MSSSLLEVRDVHTYYGESHILHGCSITVDIGTLVSLVGRNGSGKSTLVRSIVGFTPPRRGEVRLDGEAIQRLAADAIIRRGIALVPQGARIFPSLSVLENLQIAERRRDHDEAWNLERVFELFPQLEERRKNRGNELSGGEQMMLAIGRALMGNPRLLIMDEPSQGLAPLMVREVGETLQSVLGRGIAILLIEQNLPLALSVADHVYVMSKGEIVYDGTPAHLSEDQGTKQTYLGLT